MPGASTFIDAISRAWEKQRDYAHRLLADIPESEMIAQPVPGVVLNHPAWTFSHLTVYPPVLNAMLRGEPFVDPLHNKFGRNSAPENNADVYAKKEQLVAEYFRVHDVLADTMRRIDPTVMDRVVPLDRWKESFRHMADLVVHLMVDHESMHLGQVSVWRRAGGRARV